MFEPDQLAQPVDSQSPCGSDCEYEGDFLALSQAVAGKPEQQFGDTIIAAVDPDWRAVEQMAVDLLGRTKDLRVVVWLTQAATHLHGVTGFAGGVALMQLLCAQYWDDVHPRIVIDGDEDPYLRSNALAALSDGSGSYSGGSEIMRALRAALLSNRALPLTVRDVELTFSKDPTARYSDTQIVSMLADAVTDGTEAVAALEQAFESFSGLSNLVEERFATVDQPDLAALKSLLRVLVSAMAQARSSLFGEPSGGDAIGSRGDERPPVTGGAGVGEIRSREDVRRALQRVCEYLERHEPSNPASLFARRAERMLGLAFMDIMRELSPDAMSHLQMLTGADSNSESQ